MTEGARTHRFALAKYWKELAEQARQEADALPEGELKRLRSRAAAQYEHRARMASQNTPPDED